MTLDDLQTTFRNLRAAWPDAWPGLPLVLERCLARLGHEGRPARAEDRRILACMQELARLIEDDGQRRHRDGCEPAYHNRLHMADTLVALTALLLQSRRPQPAPAAPSHVEWLAMLAMLGHDYLHDGTINQSPGQLELRSAEQIAPVMMRHGLGEADRALVRELILLTDPTRVAASHQRISGRRFTVTDPHCLAVLVQEADILASSLPDPGLELTRQLAREWQRVDEQRARQVLTDAGRQGFLRFGALFSSPASQRLGLPALRAAQMAALEPLVQAAR